MNNRADEAARLDRRVALGAVLARIRGELVDLARCADDLQATIGAIVTNSPSPIGLSAQIQLQAADALSQRLERLALLTGALETEIPEGWTLKPDLKSAGKMADILARLVDPDGRSACRALKDEGECEMF